VNSNLSAFISSIIITPSALSVPYTPSPAGTSFPVITAFTPGTWSALLMSMLFIRPDEIGLRRHLPHNMFGSFKSALYCAFPVTLSSPTTLGVGLPTTCIIYLLPPKN
jgi:hypothetical protein